MGCANSHEDNNGGKGNELELKIFLLGPGGSGKTTFSKQMQIIHQGFSVERARSYKAILLANIITVLKDIGTKAKDLEDTENYKKSRWIQSLDETQIEWDDDLLEKTKSLWNDEGIQKTWLEIKDYVIIQMEYLMENLDQFMQPDYVPSNDDILRARQRTTGESTSTFEDPKRIWNLIDVGGQFSERSKWEGFFNTNRPNAIIFFLALDEYNVPNTEIKTGHLKTKLELSFHIFEQIMCSEGPVLENNICRIVFLNKVDIFREKIKDERKFADFKELLGYNGPQTVEGCTEFIQNKMLKFFKKKNKEELEIKFHVTNALDTDLMKSVTNDIKSSIVTITLMKLGMI